jgi:uncharacterized protein (DUF362 family)
MPVVIAKGFNPYKIVPNALKYFEKPSGRVVLKPNLITSVPFPTTTPSDTIDALARYYEHLGCKVVVAEGSGWCNTHEAYEALGYKKLGVELVDLNNDDYEIVKHPEAIVLREFKLPLTLKNAYLISVAVLKEHSITGVTISLKNMLGATLGEKTPVGKKRKFHMLGIEESIVDVNLYLNPKLAVIDGRFAGIGGELRSEPKMLGIMVFSEDLVAADVVATKYLGKNFLQIKHIRLAQEKGLGIADLEKIKIIEI